MFNIYPTNIVQKIKHIFNNDTSLLITSILDGQTGLLIRRSDTKMLSLVFLLTDAACILGLILRRCV